MFGFCDAFQASTALKFTVEYYLSNLYHFVFKFDTHRGLGKTVQTIAFLAWLKYNSSRNVCDQTENYNDEEDYDHMKPHIIIVPASVLSNWEREFNKFCPKMNVVRYVER